LQALTLWEMVVTAIEKREAYLIKIEQFERSAADPLYAHLCNLLTQQAILYREFRGAR
jgi:hypothetical protein